MRCGDWTFLWAHVYNHNLKFETRYRNFKNWVRNLETTVKIDIIVILMQNRFLGVKTETFAVRLLMCHPVHIVVKIILPAFQQCAARFCTLSVVVMALVNVCAVFFAHPLVACSSLTRQSGKLVEERAMRQLSLIHI